MSDSQTRINIQKIYEQDDLINTLRNSDSEPYINIVNAVGPNDKYPAPWKISRFPGCNISSIVASGPRWNTVISMITNEDAIKVLEEIDE